MYANDSQNDYFPYHKDSDIIFISTNDSDKLGSSNILKGSPIKRAYIGR